MSNGQNPVKNPSDKDFLPKCLQTALFAGVHRPEEKLNFKAYRGQKSRRLEGVSHYEDVNR